MILTKSNLHASFYLEFYEDFFLRKFQFGTQNSFVSDLKMRKLCQSAPGTYRLMNPSSKKNLTQP